MRLSSLGKSNLKPNQSLLVVNDDIINDPTLIYLPQAGQLSVSYTTQAADAQTVYIMAPGGKLTPVDRGTHVHTVKFGAALLYAGTGNGYAAFQLSWEYDVQTLEPKPYTAAPAAITSDFTGTYTLSEQSGVEWSFVSIGPHPTIPELIINLNGVENWGTAEMFLESSSSIVQFAHPNGVEFVYATLCDSGIITITYLDYSEPKTDSPATGIWLGTSSGGGTPYPPVKA